MMERLSDEILMAYADGEFDDAERNRIDRLLASDPDARCRFQLFQSTGRVLSQAFEAADRPIPAALLGGSFKGQRASEAGNTIASLTWNWLFRPIPGLAIAAALMLSAFAAGALWQMNFEDGSGASLIASRNGTVVASGALASALETAPSRLDRDVAPEYPVAILQSFRTVQGAFCREYVTGGRGIHGGHGVACREDDGVWRIGLHVRDHGGVDGAAGYAPASAGARQIVDGYIHEVMESAPMALPEERRTIENRWRS